MYSIYNHVFFCLMQMLHNNFKKDYYRKGMNVPETLLALCNFLAEEQSTFSSYKRNTMLTTSQI